MYEEMKRLYVEEGYTLRRVAEALGTNHHFVRRRLVEMGVEITRVGKKPKPFTEEHRRKLSAAKKGIPPPFVGMPHTKDMRYKNMLAHIQWDVTLDFLRQFQDIEKLKALNRLLTRDRVSEHFDTEKYKKFIEKFYYDESFDKQLKIFRETGNKYDRPSIDHIVPLSRGGSWDLTNLRIISWFENRAKSDLSADEFAVMVARYFSGTTSL